MIEKINTYCLLLIFSILVCCKEKGNIESDDLSDTSNNPLDVAFGDPFILDDGDGNFYMYGTGGGAKDGFVTYKSTDLKNWEFQGQVFSGNTENSWSVANFWAPEVYKFDGSYYMFYSADWKDNPTHELENFRIGVAVAEAPVGPFIDKENEPLFDPGYPIIDANVFQDDDGEFYLYYSRACYKNPVESEIAEWAKQKGMFEEIEESWIYGVALKDDFSGVKGDPVLLLRPPVKIDDVQAEWESRSVTSGEVNRRWTEGSFTFKKGGKYYIMYSANHFGGEHYAVGYAIGNSPLGPFEKASNNPVIEKNTGRGGVVTGTGHNSVLFSADSTEMYAVYHGRTAKTGNERLVFIDKMTIDASGKLEVHGPTTKD